MCTGSLTGKATVGLASHWSGVTDCMRYVISTDGLKDEHHAYSLVWRTEDEYPVCYNNVDSVAVSAATPGDVINLTREPASLDVGESSTHLRHPATAQLTTSDARFSRHVFLFRSTTTSRHDDVKPEPEMNCDNKEGAECRTSRDKSPRDVRT